MKIEGKLKMKEFEKEELVINPRMEKIGARELQFWVNYIDLS